MRDKPGKNPDAWLEDESTVSRAYNDLKKPEPPAHLDERILAEARRAATSPDNVVIRVQRWRKWAMPAALAATVVFAVPLVVRVFTDGQLYTDPAQPTAIARAERAALEAELAQTQRKVMELDLADSDADLAELTSPESRILASMPSANESRPPPEPAFASERADLFPPEQLGETSKTEFPEIVMDDPALKLDSSVKPAPSLTSDTAEHRTNEIFAAAPSHVDDGVAESFSDETSDSGMAGTIAAQSPPDVSRRSKTANAIAPAATIGSMSAAYPETTSADGVLQEETDYRAARLASATRDLGKEAGVEQDLLSAITVLEPEPWLTDIADLHRRGLVRTARRELGNFLQTYPDYSLPVRYPLQAADAIFDDDKAGAKTGDIVPEAESWLQGIGMMAERGNIDQARTQLAEFFAIYPDYPLPADFPLTREDAGPIER